MSLFDCRHRWRESARTFTPSFLEQAKDAGVTNMEGGQVTREFAGRYFFGFTSIELLCERCGDRRVRRFDGRVGI